MSGKGAKEYAQLLLAGSAWYLASGVANTTSRKVLLVFPSPIFLTLFQFCIATGCTRLVLHTFKLVPYVEPTSFESQQALLSLSLTYTVGFVFVNLGYVSVNVSLAETLRSAEPIVSVVLALLCLSEERVTTGVVLSLVPIVLGGVLSSMGDSTFSFEGLGFVTVSNVAFSVRSVLTKKAKKSYQGNSVSVFYHVSRIGVLVLVFVLAVGEMFSNIIGDGYLQLPDDMNLETLWTMLINGVAYSVYNQMSFFVLSKVEMVTHAVANAVRRTFTIVCSVWYFGNEITTVNAVGIASSAAGVIMYARAKRAFLEDADSHNRNGVMRWDSDKA